jgi:hypothetical protein
MVRRIALLCLALALLVNLPVVSEQGRDEDREAMDRRITWYTRKRNLGIGLTLGGVAVEAVGVVLVLNSIDYDSYDFDETAYVLGYVAVLGGAAALGIGVWQWIEGGAGKRLWEFKRGDVALRVHGPSLVGRGRLGGITLEVGY